MKKQKLIMISSPTITREHIRANRRRWRDHAVMSHRHYIAVCRHAATPAERAIALADAATWRERVKTLAQPYQGGR
jgi:hypothetical protein